MSNENINVDTGIGKIENQYGDVHFHGSEDNSFKVRKDFQSIEEDIYRLYKFGQVFHAIRDDFTHYENREDFNAIYSLEENQKKVFESLASIGADSSFNLQNILENLNELRFYPTLSSLIDDLKSALLWIKKINSILNQSKNELNNLGIDIYAVNGMNILHQQQIELLTEIERIIKQLVQSDLYQKENNLDKSEIIDDNAPETIKTSFWFFNTIKKYPITGFLILILFVGYLNKDWIYTQNKHFIDTRILKKQIDHSTKIKLDNIQSIAFALQKYFNEIKDKKSHSSTYTILTKNLSSLGFTSANLLTIDDLNDQDFDKLKKHTLLRSKFTGHVENKYPEYKYFFDSMVDLAVLLYATPSKDYAGFFNKNWKKFQSSYDYVVPDFYIDSTLDEASIRQKAQETYKKLLDFLRKD